MRHCNIIYTIRQELITITVQKNCFKNVLNKTAFEWKKGLINIFRDQTTVLIIQISACLKQAFVANEPKLFGNLVVCFKFCHQFL